MIVPVTCRSRETSPALALRNDVGLLSEEYNTHARRFLGNFLQAFSHVGLINTARRLEEARQTRPARLPKDFCNVAL